MRRPYAKRPKRVRFWEKVAVGPANECWNWTGATSGGGYGQFFPRHHVFVPAHRFSYCEFHGAIPSGLDLDHLCRNRLCVNPRHLEVVTRKENLARGVGRHRNREPRPFSGNMQT